MHNCNLPASQPPTPQLISPKHEGSLRRFRRLVPASPPKPKTGQIWNPETGVRRYQVEPKNDSVLPLLPFG
ncbi:hypothetical protein DPEC_G00271720 [Dallia pectoralis]|uniref:Uncharacterized protein n=1 Tax=Dallia pectoralis TaxID=75939 RepID=A0ACC2FPT7_DALPE|nr:hypothetical protein DPEC_G00271720 [Dallia pectoralis]